MRLLEIGGSPYLSRFIPSISDFYKVNQLVNEGETQLTFALVRRLSERLKAGDYDFVSYHLTAKAMAPWDRHGFGFRAGLKTLSQATKNPERIVWHFFHRALERTGVPLVVIDPQDAERLTKSELGWLDYSRFWFMRELPVNHLHLFLNMDSRSGDVINVRRNPVVMRNLAKLEPFSLGFYDEQIPDIPPVGPEQKIHDLFYVGANHTSTVRERGLEELKALREAGLRVYAPETRISPKDFLQACSQSWLVWSPEGQGWDCYRHYEVLMMHSVPLINYPTIERWEPFQQGVHCLYYSPERGGLSAAVREALREPHKLLEIARQGRAHILRHHTKGQLSRHVFRKMGLLAQVEPHWVDPSPV